MKECCANCKYLWKMEDWTNYLNGRYMRDVCGVFADEKEVMALYGDLTAQYAFCECYVAKNANKDVQNGTNR